MAGGRPVKWKTPEGMQVSAERVVSLFEAKQDFVNEKTLCDYLELNIDKLTEQLGYKYISHKREASMLPFARFGARPPRVDFRIEIGTNEFIYIECKAPSSQIYAEMNKGISQMMAYIIKARDYNIRVKDFWILTTALEAESLRLIVEFKLPINVCVFSKGKMAIWRHDGKTINV